MSFIADQQTLDDLNLLGKFKKNSILNLFNNTHTSGGERLLGTMFQNPLADPLQINRRSKIFQYFHIKQLSFPFKDDQFRLMENYLSNSSGANVFEIAVFTIKKLAFRLMFQDQVYEKIKAGIRATVSVMRLCKEFIDKMDDIYDGHPYFENVDPVLEILSDKRLNWNKMEDRFTNFGLINIIKFERLFRFQLKKEMAVLLQFIYHLDVYLAVGNLAYSKSFSYAYALPREKNQFSAVGVYHPAISHGTGNTVSIDANNNLFFLTGANMAGKSTLMKAIGINFYLAHMGFPVAAKGMIFSVKDGIYSSINVPDNLDSGLSHFYAEVLRVKKVAQEVSGGKDLLVIFDELFKGTNVKDAYDATLAVTEAFAEYRNCSFIISTHIIEVGEALSEHNHFQFQYLPTEMDGQRLRYTFKLSDGITSDRHGMRIIETEDILKILS